MTTNIHEEFGLLGFGLWEIGNGCTAFGLELDDGGYILITDGDEDRDAWAPEDDTETFLIGLHDEDGYADFSEPLTLEQAKKALANIDAKVADWAVV